MTDKFISIEGIAKRYPGAGGGDDRRVRKSLAVDGSAASSRCVIGHSGCGKTTVLEHPRRPRRAERRRGDRRRPGDRRHEPRPRRDLPEPRAVAVAHRARQRRLCRDLEMARLGPRQGQGACADLHRSGRPHRRRAQASVGTVRRHEAARRHCARALDHAEDHADGRAVLGARRADARHAAGRGAPHLPGDRADRVHDHPRRRRGDLPRRQDLPDDQRPRRGAGRDRREPAAEGSRPHRPASPPAITTRCATTSSIFWSAAARRFAAEVPDHDPRHVPVVRVGRTDRRSIVSKCRRSWRAGLAQQAIAQRQHWHANKGDDT